MPLSLNELAAAGYTMLEWARVTHVVVIAATRDGIAPGSDPTGIADRVVASFRACSLDMEHLAELIEETSWSHHPSVSDLRDRLEAAIKAVYAALTPPCFTDQDLAAIRLARAPYSLYPLTHPAWLRAMTGFRLVGGVPSCSTSLPTAIEQLTAVEVEVFVKNR